MRRGFGATSVDHIQEAAGISRGTFFYHFATKRDLARALLDRYAASDRQITDGFMQRAEKLATDPLQQALIFVSLHEEMFEELGDADPGCLFASYSYEAGLFDEGTHEVIQRAVQHWRETFGGKLREALARHTPRTTVDPDVLADLAYGVMQGAFILSRVEGNPRLMSEHLRQFRSYLELVFGVEPAGAGRQ